MELETTRTGSAPGRAAPEPGVRELARAEIEALLARHQVGRLAFSFRDRVDIEPISYVFRDGWLYGRTSPGTKLTTIRHNRWVAFEVDEVEPASWRSVVVRGALYLIDADHDELREQAVAAIRALTPEALTERDPAPHRTVLFRIALDEVRGLAGG